MRKVSEAKKRWGTTGTGPGRQGDRSSGYSNDPVMAEFEKYGFVGVLPKPYNLEELARRYIETDTGPP